MYYSRILSKQVLGRVIAASPDASFTVPDLASSILAVLRAETENPLHCRIYNTGGETSYGMKVGLIAELIEGGPTAHMVGRVLHYDLGFESSRHNIGYIVNWNVAQLDILDAALAVKR
ncbi:MAG: hypothetical protein ACYC36_00145 [Bellilinea sp.]